MTERLAAEQLCEACNRPTKFDEVYVTMWLGSELNIIEGVPAHVCTDCGLQYYDPDIEDRIRALAAAGFPGHLATRSVHVPVFTLDALKTAPRPTVSASQIRGI